MNKYQKIIFSIAIIFILLTTIYPPWVFTFQENGISQVVTPAGYHFIFNPPIPESHPEYKFYGPFIGIKLDISRYLAQLLGIGVFLGGIFYLLKNK